MEFAPSLDIIINETLPALQKVCCDSTFIKLRLWVFSVVAVETC